MNNEKVIFHCDCNSFYASVELLKYPELKDVPVAVAGNQDNRHGIILAKNEAAKKFNVQTAETVWQAKRKCHELKLLKPHHEEYSKYSKLINEIYSKYSDLIEPFGIDESWIDVTGSWQLFAKTPKELADNLREEIKNELGLTISVGISFNKIFAKLGSDYKKPNATTEISYDNFKEIVWPLPASDLLFVGKKAKVILEDLGIETIGNLAQTEEKLLEQILGKQGKQLYIYANGLDNSPVMKAGETEPIKSVGNGMTFKRNLLGYSDIKKGINYLSDEVAVRLRSNKLYANTIQIIIKDEKLKSISRQKALDCSTNTAKEISKAALELIEENWNLTKEIRMLTVTALQLSDVPYAQQISFFEKGKGKSKNEDKKQENLEKTMDKIRDKYGRTAILNGGFLNNDIGVDKKAKIEKN